MQPSILDKFAYTEDEEARAHEIRKMEDGERKDSRIKYFEIETGKKFAHGTPQNCNRNSLGKLSSLEIERGPLPADMDSFRFRARLKH